MPLCKVIYIHQPLAFINDMFFYESPFPAFCDGGKVTFEQVIDYQNDGTIFVQSELFMAMSARDQAAMIVHEGVYAYRRAQGDQNSANARRIVGYAFSNLSAADFGKAIEPLSQLGKLTYSSGNFEVFIGQVDHDGLRSGLKNVDVTLAALTSENVSLTATTNIGGEEYGLLSMPTTISGTLSHPQFSVHFQDGETLQGDLAPAGWSSDLISVSGSAAHSCELNTIALPDTDMGEVVIVCLNSTGI